MGAYLLPRRPAAGVLVALAVGVPGATGARAQLLFEDVTEASGILDSGQSWGASWGDADGDGWPDLYLSRHGAGLRLYRNRGDGTFVEQAAAVGLVASGDTHTAAWADFDADGDQDLVQILGAAGGAQIMPHRLFVNEAGTFRDRAAELGVDQPFARGRAPLWLDWNHDGRLDLLVANIARPDGQDPSTLFERSGAGFSVRYALPGSFAFAQLTDAMADGRPELLLRGEHAVLDVFDAGEIPFEPIGAELGVPSTPFVQDVAIADFDGDILPDLFLVRSLAPQGQWTLTQAGRLRVSAPSATLEIGLEFRSAGPLVVEFSSWVWSRAEIFVGAGGQHPASWRFALDPNDPLHQGLAPRVPGTRGIWVGYDPARSVWSVRHVGDRLDFAVDPSAPISAVTPIGWSVGSAATDALLYVHGSGGRFEEVGAAAGVRGPSECGAAAAADFDADMDVDLFVVCSGTALDAPDRLYLNDGEGRFALAPGAGGAAGRLLGRGDAVAVADYDRDGFLDLVVTNGENGPPLNDGPLQLFHNVGNANHWLEIELVGSASSSPAVGSRVLVTAGGVTQLREQTGGLHARAQDHTLLHLGLGPNALVERIDVEWPSGAQTTLHHVLADQRIRISESGGCGLGAELSLAPLLLGPALRLAKRRRRAIRSSSSGASSAPRPQLP